MRIKIKHILCILSLLSIQYSYATHVIGGEITWRCAGGGNYIFDLIFYRDCNGADVHGTNEDLQVWNHPVVSNISLQYLSRTDISPSCNSTPNGPIQLACGQGTSGGNGVGAVEKIIYRSQAIQLGGTPPASGWIFTYKDFSRSANITNLSNPTNYGITLQAKMFPIPGAIPGQCIDNSPSFDQAPLLVSCAGSPYISNSNAVDMDLDPMTYSFSAPLNNFPAGVTFDPPNNPIEVPFLAGYSFLSPTPDAAFNPLNIPAVLHPTNGQLTFTSQSTGSFVVKIRVTSYRDGIRIAEVEREMQIALVQCATNNPPVINGPFAGLWETTVAAGSLVQFTINSIDAELQWDNATPQNNILTASSTLFGTNFTSNTGCANAPCATLNNPLPLSGVQGVGAQFSWQTACNHLVNSEGETLDEIPYYFVFKVQDDFCPVPLHTYATVTVKVKNPATATPTIACIQTDANNDLTLHWTAPNTAPGNAFVYEVKSVQNGTLSTITNPTTSSHIVTNPSPNDAYYLSTSSFCGVNSDTISPIRLVVLNPNNGTAILNWNAPHTPALVEYAATYTIYREYPAGTWTLVGTVPYGQQSFRDTIDICQAQINYQVHLETSTCTFTSNSDGNLFEDMISPDMPVITSVGIDTLTGNVLITWNVNAQPDTYGYVIYQQQNNGVLIELDTIYGVTNNFYSYSTNTALGPLTYSVAAFDSCFTNTNPPTHQTSAKADPHTSVFLEFTTDICANRLNLEWSNYIGWDSIVNYGLYFRKDNGPWQLFTEVNDNDILFQAEEYVDYQFSVRALHPQGITSFSNIVDAPYRLPNPPYINYTSLVTVSNEQIEVTHLIKDSTSVKGLVLERLENQNIFKEIARRNAAMTFNNFIDSAVNTHRQTYTYRVRYIDSCGRLTAPANISTSMLLSETHDEIVRKNYLTWTPYKGFNGNIIFYRVYRSINDNWDPNPIAQLYNGTLFYEDDVETLNLENGKISYYVEAVEAINIYSFQEISRSNVRHIVYEPLIYIPNTFTPESQFNNVFFPVVSMYKVQSYEFSIIDRWGNLIFRSTDINDGWNGMHSDNSELYPVGTYMYVLSIRDGSNQEIQRTGHVNLLR